MTLPSRFQKEVHAHLSQNQQQSNGEKILGGKVLNMQGAFSPQETHLKVIVILESLT